MKYNKSEKGQAIILIVVAILGLLALTALAVDGGMAYSERRQAQNAADSAALDAGLAKVRGGDLIAEGRARAASNGFDNNGTDNTVTINNPPLTGCNGQLSQYAGNDEYIQVIIRTVTETYFGGVVGVNEVDNCVDAVARARPPINAPMALGNAIVALSETECKALTYQGNSNVTVTGGGLFANSDCAGGGNQSAFFNNSSSASLSAPCVQAVGAITYKPGALDLDCGAPQSSAAPLPPIVYPNPVCTGNATKSGNVLSPGNYSGTFPPSGVDQLQSGIYCVSGEFRMNASDTLNGSDVLIVMESGGVSWNGGATLNLSAPTSGPFAGLLLFAPESNSDAIKINGNSASTFTGSILAPSANITINGSGGASGLNCQIIGGTVDLGGTNDTTINYNAAQNYNPPTNPIVELVE